VPIVFLTAHYGLTDLAALKEGEKILIHAGAGGVGMAAIQIAQHLGAEVFATASPAKWEVLEEAGIPADHIASSRDLEFKQKFLELTGGEGVDVVLSALANEFVDASLELLPGGGRFLEMGKTDIRDPEQIAAERPGLAYRAFDLAEAGPERMGQMLAELTDRLERGDLHHAPIVSWDMRRAPEAFRHLREGRNVGKVVLSLPPSLDRSRTTLITGGTGGLGALFARHLVTEHGARHLLLANRGGPETEGAPALKTELEELGAEVTIVACDVGDRDQLEKLIGSIPEERPLGAVIHAAGALSDGVIEGLTDEQLERVFSPKADAAWHLHELSAEAELSHFVLFSSAAGVFGNPGQANYAAANAYLDALAARRSCEGLPATSIAWGLWQQEKGMTSNLSEADLARLERAGVLAISEELGLPLFEQALGVENPNPLAVAFAPKGLRAQAAAGVLPPMLSGLVRAPARRAAAGSLAAKLSSFSEEEAKSYVSELVRAEVAAVLGHSSAAAIDPEKTFQELGFDSLAAVELRNRVNLTSGLRLAVTMVFDYPTPASLAAHLLDEAGPSNAGKSRDGEIEAEFGRLATMLARVESEDQRELAAARLRELLAGLDTGQDDDLADTTDEEMFDLLDKKLGRI